MKRNTLIISAVFLIAICLAVLSVSQNIIQPKNTRIAFYETLTVSKYIATHEDTEISSLLNDLNRLEKRHLKPCERLELYNLENRLIRNLKKPKSTALLKPTTLQSVAEKYYGTIPSLETLSQIGETEFTNVMSDIKTLEQELKASGYEGTLKELVSKPSSLVQAQRR